MRLNPYLIALLFSVTVFISLVQTGSAQDAPDYLLARSFFREVDSLCSLDNGRLWGIALNGPILLVNPDTRIVVANQPDSAHQLTGMQGIYTGRLPDSVNIANTATEWAGVRWTMARWDATPQDSRVSWDRLLIHESWHRIEPRLDISSASSANPYLDELQGTILIKLELLVLRHALEATTRVTQDTDLWNALVIRKYRQSLFPGNNENAFERHEGMAEYTGYKLCGLTDSLTRRAISKRLNVALGQEGFTNSFAYLTGPAYGYLFDELTQGWTHQILDGKDVPGVAAGIPGFDPIPTDTGRLSTLVKQIIGEYDAATLIKKETEEFEKQSILATSYRQKVLGGNQLIFPNEHLNFAYNPMEKLIRVDTVGVIYKRARLTGPWGILEVRDGIFRSNGWQLFIVPAPAEGSAGTIKETGYDLYLNAGWRIVRIREGKYSLHQE